MTIGRQELDNNDNDNAIGARLFAANDASELKMKFGFSYYKGNWEDKNVNIVNLDPLTFEANSTIEALETIYGGDVSLDCKDFRLRAEAMVADSRFRSGKRREDRFAGGYEPDSFVNSGYLILAQRLPWFELEPFLFFDYMIKPSSQGTDGILAMAVGANVYSRDEPESFSVASDFPNENDYLGPWGKNYWAQPGCL